MPAAAVEVFEQQHRGVAQLVGGAEPGQTTADGNVVFNGTVLGASQFSGSDGSLWDTNSYNVTVPAAPEYLVTHAVLEPPMVSA